MACKTDLHDKIKVSAAEAHKLMEKHKSIIGFYETSTKTGENVNEIFVKLLLHNVRLNQDPTNRMVSTRPLPVEVADSVDSGDCCVIM